MEIGKNAGFFPISNFHSLISPLIILEGKMKKISVTAAAMILAFSLTMPVLHAGELAGVTLEDKMHVGDKTVTLTGMGVRTKTILKVLRSL